MSGDPKISLIIPMYNVEKYLRRCLDSVANQTFTDWQAICVNDGSTDKSGEIAAEYAARDSRFVVINKENTGQSDSRNIGTVRATGEYIMYLDADDFIHPQTMELLYKFGRDNNADMVVFRHDVHERMVMQKMADAGKDISDYVPRGCDKKYNLNKISCRITDNILRFATDRNHAFGRWRVKKCYPVLKMLRRELAQSHKFINGIIIEDFPWWSEIMFSRPRTVIAKVPLYFYTPNMKSSLNSSDVSFVVKSICTGLEYVYKNVLVRASDYELVRFNREFLWSFIITVMRSLRDVSSATDIEQIRKRVSQLYKIGVFDNPPTGRARKYRRRIENFIFQDS